MALRMIDNTFLLAKRSDRPLGLPTKDPRWGECCSLIHLKLIQTCMFVTDLDAGLNLIQ